MIAQGAKLKGRYRLERVLGHGGMAAVWLAQDEVLERPVAIKVLSDTIASDPAFLARFRREAQVAAGVSHPNLVGVYDYAEGDERPYLVMEYVPGETLAARMRHGGGLSCQRLAQELLGAVAHIHAAGIVHRDIKPQNVLIAPDGSAKLIDFGIALPRDATALTRTGHLLGTARFIAPEVMAGDPATERSDLFSCGVLLRDCLGDRSPGHLRVPVTRLCDEDPGRRPASAAAALALIGRAETTPEEATQPFETIPAPPTPTTRLELPGGGATPGRHRPWGRVAAAAGIVAGLAVAVVMLTSGSGEQKREGRGGKAAESRTVTAGGGRTAESSADAEPEPQSTEPSAEEIAVAPEGSDPESGSALNEEGFALIQSGAYSEAVPVLEEAVRAFPPETEDLDYAYALFNLGSALRLSGRPEEAIPLLEQRLAIPNQTAAVRSELEAAEAEAGL